MTDPVPDEFLTRLSRHMDPAYRRVAEELIERRKGSATECHWTEDCGSWATQCKHDFLLNDGTPSENGMKFCCYCGKPLKEFPEQLEEIEND